MKIKVGVGKSSFESDDGQWIKAKAHKSHDSWDYPHNNVAFVKLGKSASTGSACFPNKSVHDTCFPPGVTCASVGLNRSGEWTMRPMQTRRASENKGHYVDEFVDLETFADLFIVAGSEKMKPNKLCDWRPGGSALYCRRTDGPWVLTGIETLAESCNSQEGKESVRPALFHKVDSSSEWLMVNAGLVSQMHPFQCGSEDVTRLEVDISRLIYQVSFESKFKMYKILIFTSQKSSKAR